ncbi:DUF4397 domain-containing protein [Natronorubrum bangense]|uniref:DUF4397 domain-containing protein n=1 Tax=Natronorubrum bangense JCM 10635 TaxID=1227500 RepID=L9W8V2_9EURY|nr:DUF4397 domain-containing protein [Natronorubrum bangense]ELY45905.1 hypothetical protein C494_15083 [Natronorubrum bangense JCM 10635]
MTENGVSRRRIIQIGGGGLVVVSGIGGTTAASSDHETNDQPTDTGFRTRVAHLSPDAPNIDIYVDGERVREGIPYGTVTDYRDLEPGTYTIQVVPAGEDPAEAVLEETVEAGDEDPTVDGLLAVIGEVAAENQPLEALFLDDDNSPVDPGTARVRVLHASPDAPAVDVVAGENGDALFENVAFGESGYTEVPEGEYTLEIYPAGDREASAFEIDVSLSGGTVYSAFAIGYLETEGAPADEPFEILLTEDALPDEADVEPDEEEPKEDEPEKEPEEDPKEDEPEKEPEKEPKEDEPEKEPEKEPKEDEPKKEPEKEPKEDEPEKEPEKEPKEDEPKKEPEKKYEDEKAK